jgi:hypothetical protein
MLVLAPEKRFTVEQVKKHRWMVAEGPPRLLPSANPPSGEPNEQILRLMQSLGIDAAKTKEVMRQVCIVLFNLVYLYASRILPQIHRLTNTWIYICGRLMQLEIYKFDLSSHNRI